MAKSTNHTNHNQITKHHKNGIKKPARQRYSSLKGVNQRFLRCRKRSLRFDPKVIKNKNVMKRVAALRALKAAN